MCFSTPTLKIPVDIATENFFENVNFLSYFLIKCMVECEIYITINVPLLRGEASHTIAHAFVDLRPKLKLIELLSIFLCTCVLHNVFCWMLIWSPERCAIHAIGAMFEKPARWLSKK